MLLNQVANDTVSFLEQKAVDIRKDIINMIHYAGAGHPGGALSAADIITALYFHVMNIDPKNPKDEGRDRFVLSKGHACPALYAALAERGFFGMEHLETLRQNDSILQGHPDMNKTPGIDITTGSLGNGLSIGVGMAMLASILDKEYNVYVLLGDGELQEGSVWEAAMAASHHRLRNLIAIVDYNGLQINGWVNNELRIEPLEEKWKAFGWQVIRIDGHCMKEIIHAFSISKKMCGPTVIIADTIKGKGVSFMENVAEWHGKAPNVEQAKTAVFEILHGGENNVAFNKNGVW